MLEVRTRTGLNQENMSQEVRKEPECNAEF